MGWVQQCQLPDELDSALSNLKEGGMTSPVRSLTGYHILILRKIQTVSQTAIPPRPEIGSQIGTERLDRAQRRYLLDLKAAAFVEKRV
jgi:peptidyl-prolyl cis-trans isomerase SurA